MLTLSSSGKKKFRASPQSIGFYSNFFFPGRERVSSGGGGETPVGLSKILGREFCPIPGPVPTSIPASCWMGQIFGQDGCPIPGPVPTPSPELYDQDGPLSLVKNASSKAQSKLFDGSNPVQHITIGRGPLPSRVSSLPSIDWPESSDRCKKYLSSRTGSQDCQPESASWLVSPS